MKRPNTFQYWDSVESGPITSVSKESYKDYVSEYTVVYNMVRSLGGFFKRGYWFSPDKKKKVKTVYEMLEYLGGRLE